ncbi:MAG: hypothetical protein HFE78_04740 [Clostridiales bacterium]|nr:hypothetical protein [Clostridiales bacterium]
MLLILAIYACFVYALFFRIVGYEWFIARIGVINTNLVFFLLFLLSPIAVFLSILLQQPSFEGEVIAVDRKNVFKLWKGGLSGKYEFQNQELWVAVYAAVRRADGKIGYYLIRKYAQDDPLSALCEPGDIVRHYRGTRIAQIFKREGRRDTECVMCGLYAPTEAERCPYCGALILKNPPPFPEKQEVNPPVKGRGWDPSYQVPSYAGKDAVPDDAIIADQRPVTKSGTYYSAPVPIPKMEIDYTAPDPEHNEKYKRKVRLSLDGNYFLYVILFYLVTSCITLNARGFVHSSGALAVLYLVISGIIPLIFSILIMRNYPRYHYREGKAEWVGQSIRFLLPGELIRVFISFFPIAYNAFGGFFSPMARIIWELCYILPTGQYDRIEERLYIPIDFGIYMLIALLGLIVRLMLLMLFYKIFWDAFGRERRDLLAQTKIDSERTSHE